MGIKENETSNKKFGQDTVAAVLIAYCIFVTYICCKCTEYSAEGPPLRLVAYLAGGTFVFPCMYILVYVNNMLIKIIAAFMVIFSLSIFIMFYIAGM